VTIQCKYLGLACKLLTTVRASITSGKEEGLEWADHIEDIAKNFLIGQINVNMHKIKGVKKHEQQRLLREIIYEFYSIRTYYMKEVNKNENLVCEEAPLKMLKKLEYLDKRDPLTLFHITTNAKEKVGGIEQVTEALNNKIKREIKSHPR
jgi:hypothetical protein